MIFTAGHSNHSVADFCGLLSGHEIQVVVDVRSAPYSRYVTWFNKREIEVEFTGRGFKYLFMGDVIGGKPQDPAFRDAEGRVDYSRLTVSEKFQAGIDRLVNGGTAGWRIVLMCAEEDPLKCHRHLLIAKELEFSRRIAVQHFRGDGSTLRARDFLKLAESPRQGSLFHLL